MPRGRPKKPPEIIASPVEDLIAIYITKYLCLIPGCDYKIHRTDVKNIIKILETSKEVEVS